MTANLEHGATFWGAAGPSRSRSRGRGNGIGRKQEGLWLDDCHLQLHTAGPLHVHRHEGWFNKCKHTHIIGQRIQCLFIVASEQQMNKNKKKSRTGPSMLQLPPISSVLFNLEVRVNMHHHSGIARLSRYMVQSMLMQLILPKGLPKDAL